MIIERVDDKIVVMNNLWEHKDRLLMVPGLEYRKAQWKMPLSWAGCLQLRGIFGPALDVGPELAAWSVAHKQNVFDLGMSLRNTVQYDRPPAEEERLYVFQEPGRDMLAHQRWMVLADEMGTGKTIQAISAMVLLDRMGFDIFPMIIVCPNSVKKQWAHHLKDRIPDCNPIVLGGGAVKRKKLLEEAQLVPRSVVIINIEAVRLHSRVMGYGNIKLGENENKPKELNKIPFKLALIDEAHLIASPNAKQTRAVWATFRNKTIERRWALTGTPIRDNVSDFWSILHAIAPSEFPEAKSKFVDRYAMQSFDIFGGLQVVGIRPDTKEEFFKIIDPHFRRMPKALVLPFLPKKVRVVREAEMSAKQARAYGAMSKEMVTRLEDGRLVLATNNLTKNTRLLQFSSAYAEVDDHGDVHLKDPSSKIDVLLEIIEEAGKPIVACAESRQLIELAAARLEKKKISYRMLTGGMTDDQRAAVIRDFAAGNVQVFLFVIKAGGTGVDGLQHAADTLVFLQRSWSLVQNLQAEDRVHRIGSEVHDSITIIDVVAPNTVEVDQIAALYDKAARLEEITRDKATLHIAAERGDHAAQARMAQLDQELTLIEQEPLWAA